MAWSAGNSTGTLSSAHDGRIIETIFKYVTDQLRNFQGSSDENEDNLTDEFCKKLGINKPSEYPFFFQHQNIEKKKGGYSTDMAALGTKAINNGEMLTKFEAKRLSSHLPNNRRREYVVGEYSQGNQIKNSGGIERFKNETHGVDIQIAGMIGYVQTYTFDHWQKHVNSCIQDEISTPHDENLTWEELDKLQNQTNDGKVATYKSESSRLTKSRLMFRHFWVNLQ
ncbi:MAG: hypothetical protein BRD50_08780 [Bacteroidetes bacterium SW_11_45_7]|nr:MAG: hypothetical protein BRD50_08780 [Bacteroidetes bacterium SW_11_45_7]